MVSTVNAKELCLGQKCVEEKTNEIKVISDLLDCLNIKETIVTMEAIGTILRRSRQPIIGVS